MESPSPSPITLIYKTIQNTPLNLDVYLPSTPSPLSPAVVYFHGGGLTVGNRRSWFPAWLHKRTLDSGHVFICPDYRLLPSGSTTGHEILDDIKDAFAFLVSEEFQGSLAQAMDTDSLEDTRHARSIGIRINPDRMGVAGSSSGGLCAYLAAMHARPKPRAVISLYGMGGDFLTPHYYTPKTTVFFRGRELLDPENFKEFMYPASTSKLSPSNEIIADSPTAYHPSDSPRPGYPANPRMLLARLYLQLGVYLDYYTGEHEPSFSVVIRDAVAESEGAGGDSPETETRTLILNSKQRLLDLIPPRHRPLFPCFGIDSSWPPTFLLHGSEDSAVPVHESRYMHDLLVKAGVPTQLVVAEAMEHSFDYQPEAEVMHRDHFDRIVEFLNQCLLG